MSEREKAAIRFVLAQRSQVITQHEVDKFLKTVGIYEGAGGDMNIYGLSVPVDKRLLNFLRGIAARKTAAATIELEQAREALANS